MTITRQQQVNIEYKTTPANINELNTEVIVPLKYLSNF